MAITLRARGTTNHRAPNRGARKSWEGAFAGSGVARHGGNEAALSLAPTVRRGFPRPAARSCTRAQGSSSPLPAPLRPGQPIRGAPPTAAAPR